MDDCFQRRGKLEGIKKENDGRWCSRVSDQRDLLLQPRALVPPIIQPTEDNEEAEVVHNRDASITTSEDLCQKFA